MRSYLVVDDNRAFAENLAEVLEDTGAAAEVACSGAEALALIGSRRFDAIVSDMRMPEMGGAELMHRMRRLDPGLPAIVVTAYVNDSELAAVRREGLMAVLHKPVPISRLVEMLAVARRGGLVALVEDDAALADNLAEALRELGFAAVIASSVKEVEVLVGVQPFCALVDLRVPGGTDGEAMRRLHAASPGLPLVLVTAHAALAADAMPLEPFASFIKPFDTSALLAVVEELHARDGRPSPGPRPGP